MFQHTTYPVSYDANVIHGYNIFVKANKVISMQYY